MELINWLWLEDLLVRACELEVRAFGREYCGEPVFAFCLEHDGLDGALHLSYATRSAVDRSWRSLQSAGSEASRCYREVELRPQYWRWHQVPLVDPEGAWEPVHPILARYRRLLSPDLEPEVAEFLWLRFEYLAECVVRQMIERAAFRYLNTEPEFLAYSAHEHESLEELEDRLEKLYARYVRATAEWSGTPRMGELPARRCDHAGCPGGRARPLYRCTYCHIWRCDRCLAAHTHPELMERRPFFAVA